MTLVEFARAVGVSQATASRWETGDRYPTYAHLVKINEMMQSKRPAGEPPASGNRKAVPA